MIKINGKYFANSLPQFGFNRFELENFMKEQRLVFHGKIKEAEFFPAPSMSKCFNRFVDVHKRFPCQAEFCDTFLSEHNAEIQRVLSQSRYKGIEETILTGLRYRAERAYPSLTRDIHFAIYLKDKGYDVFWNSNVDVNYKMDVVVTIDGQRYGLALFTDTRRGNSNRERKKTEASVPEGFIEIPIPLDMNEECLKVGDYYLYGEREEKIMLDKIRELKSKSEEPK